MRETINDLVRCIPNATSVRLFTDEASRWDGREFAPTNVVNDYAAWQELAACGRYYIPLSMFSLTAAAASGVSPERLVWVQGNGSRALTCSSMWKRLNLGRPLYKYRWWKNPPLHHIPVKNGFP